MTLVIFLVMLSILVMVHELGHFVMAKRAGILVEEFGFGLPPRLWGKKIGETTYSINWLPIGGFVKLYGEDQVEVSDRSFSGKSKSVRASILLAGVVMNFALGVTVFSVIYTIMGVPGESGRVEIVEVLPDSPAIGAGIKAGEVVLSVDEQVVKTSDEFVNAVNSKRGKEVEMLLGSADKYGRLVKVKLREQEAALGVVVSSTEAKHFAFWQMPFRGAWFGLKEALLWGGTIVMGLITMIKNLLGGVVPKDIAGPVGIYQLTGDVAQAGVLSLLQFMGILSVNLAVLNVLPLPALDGGRLLFLGIEAVTGTRIGDGKLERWVHTIGLAVLLSLMVLITVNDVVRLTGSGNMAGLFNRWWPF